ncbi:tandem-95 repeat protein, partial [Clostridium magnum]
MARKKIIALSTLSLVLYGSYANTSIVKAEGSRDLVKNGGYRPYLRSSAMEQAGISGRTIFKVYVKAGETIYLGSSAYGYDELGYEVGNQDIWVKAPDGNGQYYDVNSSTGVGFIDTVPKESTGPSILGSGGYTPISITATETGIYEVEFIGYGRDNSTDNLDPKFKPVDYEFDPTFENTQNGQIAAWDITVVDSSGIEKKGRVFTSYISLYMGGNSTDSSHNEKVLNSDFYVLTKDGYQYKTSMNGVDPNGFMFFSNNRGFIDKTNNMTLYHTVSGDDDNLTNIQGNVAPQLPTAADTATDITHNVFLNVPSSDLPQDTLPTNAIAPATASNFVFNGTTAGNLKTLIGEGGTFTFDSDKFCSYKLIIDTDKDGKFDASKDRVIENIATVGANTVSWDGKDASGNIVGAGNYSAQIVMKGGEYHFPIIDAEYNPFGIKVDLINAPSSFPSGLNEHTVYYDESNYKTANGTSVNLGATDSGNNIDPVSGLSGIDSSAGAHSFFGNTSNGGYGNHKGIDTWTYFPGNAVTLSFRIDTAPTVEDISKSGAEDKDITFEATDFTGAYKDADTGDSLTKIKITNLPSVANGTLSLNGTSVTVDQEISDSDLAQLKFTPAANWNGTTSFGWNGSDGTAYATTPATATITLDAVNDNPTAVEDTAITDEDKPVIISVLGNDSDIDGDSISVDSVTQPENGTVAINGDGKVTYIPKANFNGTDTFTYTVSDGKGGTSTATVTVTVNPVKDNPTISEVDRMGNEDEVISFTAGNFESQFTDPDGDKLTQIKIESLPANGILKLNGLEVKVGQEISAADLANLTFTPSENWNGTTSFNWKGSDGTAYSETTTVDITVLPVNDAPIVENITVPARPEDVAVTFTAEDFSDKFTDVDGNSLAKTQVTSLPENGILSLNGVPVKISQEISVTELVHLTFTPIANWNGSTSFGWNGSDGTAYSAEPATVGITISSVNDAPTAVADTATTEEDAPVKISVLANDSDIDGDSLAVSGVGTPTNGTVVINEDGTVTYTPNTNFNGTDTFTYTVSDGKGGTSTETVTVTV